ncbi:Maf family nucleotide pyrophosphatase [Nitrosomonadales bacterium]|nr:Maf family nucleotide pyrophosphatase [Nitrosomonadales bacterium]
MSQIILASSSIYRKELLQRILSEFKVLSPNIDEKKIKTENAYESAQRLAEEKAKKISNEFREAIVIGCDQTAEYNNIQIEKPLNFKLALSQLKELSGKQVNFHSAICVTHFKKNISHKKVISFNVKYKDLSLVEIENYLNHEKPFNCVGSIKSEGLGISLLEEINSSDPTAIIGLPLIALVTILNKFGVIINGKA